MFNRCTFIRWSISKSLDQGERLTEKAQEHCNHCEDCAGFLQQSKLLQVNLNRSIEIATNPERSQRIVRQVHRQARPIEQSAAPLLQHGWLRRAVWISAACLILSLIFLMNQTDPAQTEMANLHEDILSLTDFVQSVSEPLQVLASP